MSRQRIAGFTLIEMMIAVTISMILMAGVLSIFISSKRTYVLQDELSKLQENARFIFDDITYSLRMAGYFGCSGKIPRNAPATINMNAFTPNENNLKITDTNAVALTKAVPLSDRLSVNYFGSPLHSPVATDANTWDDLQNPGKTSVIFDPSKAVIPLSPDNLLPSVGDTLVVSDCGGAEVYTVKTATAASLTLNTNFLRMYFWPVNVTRIIDPVTFSSAISYEVRGVDKTGNGTANDIQDGFMLFKTAGGQMRPFIEGVENLQIRYGVDTNADGIADIYSTQPTGGKVVSARITLLMRTGNYRADLGPDTATYQLDPDVTYTPADVGYRRRLISTTVDIRN
ncbi:MAG: PilW family protein [Thiotrichaceae bacterium]|nr:PilW family protein [Thiotrichaceae bacterium]